MNKRLEAILRPKIKNTWGIRPPHPNMKASYTLAQLDAMYAASNGCCQICGGVQQGFKNGKPKNLAIDHCHKTGNVRGLLCTKCNTALGHFNDDPALLMRAIDYLTKSIV